MIKSMAPSLTNSDDPLSVVGLLGVKHNISYRADSIHTSMRLLHLLGGRLLEIGDCVDIRVKCSAAIRHFGMLLKERSTWDGRGTKRVAGRAGSCTPCALMVY